MKPFVELAPKKRTLPVGQFGSVVMMNRALRAGAFLGLLGLVEAAPAWADGPAWGRPHGHHGGAKFVERHGGFGPPRRHAYKPFRRYGSFTQPARRFWRSRLAAPAAGLLAESVSVGYAEPAVSVVTATYGFAAVDPICGSYAAPVGYHGVIYNRPFCPCD
jgi:hypothetical protein